MKNDRRFIKELGRGVVVDAGGINILTDDEAARLAMLDAIRDIKNDSDFGRFCRVELE